jgi:hypothetical protein
MLDDVCTAVETTIAWEVVDNQTWARRVIERFPVVRAQCDQLRFSDPAQALAYLVLHAPDRYCRMFQVLEHLLEAARLPLGKRDSFAAIDIGAGPGPGIFAIRHFYALLAYYARMHHPEVRIGPLCHADVVEYSQAMPLVMRRFGRALLLVERGHVSGGGDNRPDPHPCAEELERSAAPLEETYRDFSVFDVHREHHLARRRRAEELYREDELDLSWAGANRLAYEEAPDRPSGYALVSMMNFLTPGSHAFPRFSEAIDKLMEGALVPGGTILVLGAGGIDYQEIYRELDQRLATPA